MMEINRSSSSDDAKRMVASLKEEGWIEARSIEEARQLEATGKSHVYVDHTNNGKDSFSEAEMKDFRLTPIEHFLEHQKRWGRL